MKDINKYGRNNRTCIELLDINHFFDYSDPEYFYLCNDMLNLAHVMSGDIIRFNLLDNDKEKYKVFGIVVMACNINKTTFLVCRHYDDTGREYIQDYKYSSFNHAFEKLNDPHRLFIPWEEITNNKNVKTPHELVILWEECNYLDKVEKVKDQESKYGTNDCCERDYDVYNDTFIKEVTPLDKLSCMVKDLETIINTLTKSIHTLTKSLNNSQKEKVFNDVQKGI